MPLLPFIRRQAVRFAWLAAVFLSACGGGGGGAGGGGSDGAQSGGGGGVAPDVTISASPISVSVGGTSTLSWSTSNADSCSASGGWSGTKALNGSEVTAALNASTTFQLSCSGTGGTTSRSVTVIVNTTSSSAFPLRTEAGKRYLIDAQGNPFLVHGDTAWSLIVQLTDAEVDQYLNDRQAKGFNTLLVNLIEHHYADSAPRNAAGDAPFLTANDFSTPNEAYFAHAASVIQKAADRNMLVLLTPAYMGYNGGNEGWYKVMTSNGATKLRSYGRYLANRFSAFNNIVWVHGGDYSPPNRSLLDAIANGIHDVNTSWLHTFHGSPESAARDFIGTSSWLDINTVYSYDTDLSGKVRAQYNASSMPLIMIESRYEAESNGSAQYVRSHAYQSLLAGASGQIFGNNPIWHFDAPNAPFAYPGTWKTALNSAGSTSMQALNSLWSSFSWWALEPTDSLVVNGHAAVASDQSFAVVYVTESVTVKLGSLAKGGADVQASWFNPFSGDTTTIGTFPTSDSRSFTIPGSNGDANDWVLVLKVQP